MEKKANFSPSRIPSRPDRSRSPHCERYQWEKAEEPKSVLYPADILFHRRSLNTTKGSNRSPTRSSSSPSKHNRTTVYSRISPVKERPQINRGRTTSLPHNHDSHRIVRMQSERMQRYNQMHNPSKSLAVLMSKDNKYSPTKTNHTTPKSRKNEPWIVEFYTKGPFVYDRPDDNHVRNSREESLLSKENIRIIEQPIRRTNASPTSEDWKRLRKDSSDIHTVLNNPASEEDCDVMKMGAAGCEIPLTHKDVVTPSNSKDPQNAATPENYDSPNDVFYTPMTHLRVSRREKSSFSDPHYSGTVHQFSPLVSKPQFSLITESISVGHSPLDRSVSIKERTEAHLAVYDRISSHLDIAIKQARDVLSKPIRLGLPPLDSSEIPPFNDNRQTIDPSQLERLKQMREELPSLSRHSLPADIDFSKFRNPTTAIKDLTLGLSSGQSPNERGKDFENDVESSSSEDKRMKNVEISLPKALGASMAAELAYAERVEKTQLHLDASRCFAKEVEEKIRTDQQNKNADIDALLDSIVLQDRSPVTNENEMACSLSQTSAVSVNAVTRTIPQQIPSSSSDNKHVVLSEEEREDRRVHVQSYIRMHKHLHSLQLVILRLKKKLAGSQASAAEFDNLIDAANAKHGKAVEDAELLLTQRFTPKEFLMIIKHRQQKVYDATEECSDTIKQLLNLDAPDRQREISSRKSVTVAAHKRNAPSKGSDSVRIDTKALNDSVSDGDGDLSARTMRRNLEARREQAEMLNKSFEERSKDIEQKTKKSIAVQLVKYDRVIAERTNLISHLEKISTEGFSEMLTSPLKTPPPHREGIAPLDFSQLSQEHFIDEVAIPDQSSKNVSSGMLTHFDEEQADEGISRTFSQSMVHEDSLSHFGDDEEKPASSSSEPTLYKSDIEDKSSEMSPDKKTDGLQQPSRRTLDTAETLAMLSRHIVTKVDTTSQHDDVNQEIQSIINEAVLDSVKSKKVTDDSTGLETFVKAVPDEKMTSDGHHAEEANVIIDSCAGAKEEDHSIKGQISSKTEQLEPIGEARERKPRSADEARSLPSTLIEASSKVALPDAFCAQDLVSQPPGQIEVSAVVRPPKDFSRLRLFFGSPDEPTEDGVDYQPTDDDDIPNYQFVTRTEPHSDVMAENTDNSDQFPETTSANDDGEVPVVTLRRFVYKESVMTRKYQEDPELEKTQWEMTPSGSPVGNPSRESSTQKITLSDAFILDLSHTQGSDKKETEPEQLAENNEWLTDDEQPSPKEGFDEEFEQSTPKRILIPPLVALKKQETGRKEEPEQHWDQAVASGDQANNDPEHVTAIEKLDLSILENDGVTDIEEGSKTSTEELVPPSAEFSSPVNLVGEQVGKYEGVGVVEDQQNLSKSTSVEEKSSVEDRDAQKDSTGTRPDSSKSCSATGEAWHENSKLCPDNAECDKSVNEISLMEPTSDGRPSVDFNRSQLCDSLSTTIMEFMTKTASPSLSSVVGRYQLSDSLLEDSISSVSKSPRTMQDRFTTKMPASLSPRSKVLLEESLNSSLVETIVKSEAVMAVTDEKLREIDEQIASLKVKSPSVEKVGIASATDLNTSQNDSFEDLLSVEKPYSLFDKLGSTHQVLVDLPLKHVADTPRKPPPQGISLATPKAIERQHHAELTNKLDSPEWMEKMCRLYSKVVWNFLTSEGFVRPIYDHLVSAPTYSDDELVETEDERDLLDNKKTLIWAAVTELAAMLWPEHPERGDVVSSKWLPIPSDEEQFSEMAVQYINDQFGELPPSHRYKRQFRPSVSSPADDAIDESVARLFYGRGINNFARGVDAEYRSMCGELINLVGDRFVSREILQMYLRLDDDVNESLLTPSTSSMGRLSGDFGRPSLARLSIGSNSSIGRRSSANAVIVKSLGVVHEE
uniref:PH domain-containing protein n=1 Tax=Haemonchus contortus TaxID=6289 RepID=A0A7I5E864_HAECO